MTPSQALRLMRPAMLVLCGAVLAACAGRETENLTTSPEGGGTSGSGSTSDNLASFYITVPICNDTQGPDCTKLRLGDRHLTTTQPARGTLYSCTGANSSAPGSIRSRITWIDEVAQTWNLLRKPFLPAGAFTAPGGAFTILEQGGTRVVQANNLPVDGKIGDWPMTRYSVLTAIDPNPGTPSAKVYRFDLPLQPAVASTPGCVSLGAIGVTTNGVVLYNAMDARGNDAVAHEIVDAYGGHPAQSDYHYHFLPDRLDRAPLPDGHSGIVGWIRDGFPLYGYKGIGGVELTNADLDECHGHAHGTLGYHYHATIEYPYTVGCYRGTPR